MPCQRETLRVEDKHHRCYRCHGIGMRAVRRHEAKEDPGEGRRRKGTLVQMQGLQLQGLAVMKTSTTDAAVYNIQKKLPKWVRHERIILLIQNSRLQTKTKKNKQADGKSGGGIGTASL
ncbi:hypothetical protein P7K49_028544 [Saguinus oedipus]|uniref:Uncharacterized protein n=1 Tax=Saguinus oedipus TaxID=9490 RepID=A0ABQ9U5A8_SAGOE|nr:hypothetical protein P7K49_028544 [Saguinus oedipus]